MEIRNGSHFSGNNKNKKKSGKRGLGREKIVMLVTSVTVLTVLTVTGIYVGQRKDESQDQQRIDFSSVGGQEESVADSGQKATDRADGFVEHDDLDVDPELYRQYMEANSGDVQNPDLAKKDEEETTPEPVEEKTEEDVPEEEDAQDSAPSMSSMTVTQTIEEKKDALIFQAEEPLAWPVVGNVIVNYSMDSYVYFATLGQYRYSDAIVIAATEGEHITAAADGVVTDVSYNEEIGNTVTVALGSGYEMTYGQLDDVQVAAGDTVSRGELLGTVAEPTKYYSVEGPNVYFKMTKDDEPVNPLTLLQ